MSRRLLPLSLLLACPAVLFAQQPASVPPARADESPVSTLRLATRIVVLDIVVTDRHGKLVDNLKQDDFTIVDNQTAQTIRSFEPPSAHLQPADVVVSSTADLRHIGDAPVTLLVIDGLNTRFEDLAFARQSLTKYLQAQPPVLHEPTELLMVGNTRFQLVDDFTQNRDELLDKIKHQPAEFPYKAAAGKAGLVAVERIAQSLASLEQIAQATAGTRGRKNVIWVGAGFPSVNPVLLDPRTAATLQNAVNRCTNMLLASRVTLYTIDPTLNGTSTIYAETPEDLEAAETENGGDPMAGGIRFSTFAPATGGRAFSSRNDVNNEIAEGIAAGNDYYTLSYRPADSAGARNAASPDRYRTVRILLRDKNLRATTRDGYYPIPAESGPQEITAARSPKEKQARAQLQLDLASAVGSALPYNTLAVSAAHVGPDYIVTVDGAGLSWRSDVTEATILAAWYDAKGKVLGHVGQELTATRSARQPDAVFRLPVPAIGSAARLRIVVRDAVNAHMGTLDLKP